jgi:hypothetical protein
MCPVQYRLHGSIELLSQPRRPWTDILLDFNVGLLVSRRKCHEKPYNAILVGVNWYTKQACYFPYHNTLDAVGLAKILTRKLVLQGAGIH